MNAQNNPLIYHAVELDASDRDVGLEVNKPGHRCGDGFIGRCSWCRCGLGRWKRSSHGCSHRGGGRHGLRWVGGVGETAGRRKSVSIAVRAGRLEKVVGPPRGFRSDISRPCNRASL